MHNQVKLLTLSPHIDSKKSYILNILVKDEFLKTLKSVSILLEGFKIVSTSTLKNRKCGRSTGGLAVIFKSKFYD